MKGVSIGPCHPLGNVCSCPFCRVRFRCILVATKNPPKRVNEGHLRGWNASAILFLGDIKAYRLHLWWLLWHHRNSFGFSRTPASLVLLPAVLYSRSISGFFLHPSSNILCSTFYLIFIHDDLLYSAGAFRLMH